jgi:hypothetical protein
VKMSRAVSPSDNAHKLIKKKVYKRVEP